MLVHVAVQHAIVHHYCLSCALLCRTFRCSIKLLLLWGVLLSLHPPAMPDLCVGKHRHVSLLGPPVCISTTYTGHYRGLHLAVVSLAWNVARVCLG